MSTPIQVKLNAESKGFKEDDDKFHEFREKARQREEELLSKMRLSEFSSDKFSQMTKSHHTRPQKSNSFYKEQADGTKKYILELEIGDFQADEVEVSVNGDCLLVKGSNEIKQGSVISRNSFKHETMLPDHLNLTKSTSNLSEKVNGVCKLVFEAPMVEDKFYSRRSTLNEHEPKSTQRSSKGVSFESKLVQEETNKEEETFSEHFSSSTSTTKKESSTVQRT